LLKCEDLNYGSVCSKCLRYQIISYSPLVLKQASAILRDAEKFHAQQKAFVNERLEPWTKS